jgi:hypothetical protein
MLFSQGREDQSVVEWAKVVGPLVEEAKGFPAPTLAEFTGTWAKSVSYIGQAELYARRSERYEVFGSDERLAAFAHEQFKKYNARGVEGLGVARKQLAQLRPELIEFDRQLASEGRDVRAELEEFRTETYAGFAEIEVKRSDAEQFRDMADRAITVAGSEGLAGLARWADGKLREATEARKRPDRGAETNFAFWKLAAVVALLLVLGIAFWIHCGWFSCSAYSRDNYIKAILVTAGLWWC